MKEKIDVLLATYNGEKYLKEQIDSILNQTYQNIHLIISDDCSKDETQKILKEYKEKDDRITVYIQEQNLGYIKNFELLGTGNISFINFFLERIVQPVTQLYK